jgi:hypothetical protein
VDADSRQIFERSFKQFFYQVFIHMQMCIYLYIYMKGEGLFRAEDKDDGCTQIRIHLFCCDKTYTYMFICIYIYIHIYICIHIYMYLYIYIYIIIQVIF